MKAVKFKEQNVVIAKDQDQYGNLPAFNANDPQGTRVTCWRLSFIERLTVLFTGRVWHVSLTFGNPFHPMRMHVKRSDVFITNKSEE